MQNNFLDQPATVFIPVGPRRERGRGKRRPPGNKGSPALGFGCLEGVSVPRRGRAGAAVLSCGFAMACRVSAELPGMNSPSRDLWGCEGGLAPSTDVSRLEVCQGWRLRLRRRPQRRVGAAWSRRRGVVCSAWRGGTGSSRWWFSEEERTAVTATCSAVSRLPPLVTCTPQTSQTST